MDVLSDRLLAITGLLGLIITLYLWRVKTQGHKMIKGTLLAPEVPGGLPFVGHLHKLRGKKTLFRALADMAEKFGPIFTIYLGVHKYLVVSDYEAIKECVTTNDKSFANRPRVIHGTYLGYNNAAFGLAPYGAHWRNMRKLVVIELLSTRKLEALKHVRAYEVETFIKDLYGVCESNGFCPANVVISRWLEHLTLNVITQMVAGKRYFNSGSSGSDEEAERIGRIIKEYLAISGAPVLSDMIPIPKWVDSIAGKLKAMKRIGKQLDCVLQSWMEEHYTKRDKTSSSELGNKNYKQDFIDVMLSTIEDDSTLEYSRETIIKATVANMIVGGSDTTAIGLEWVLSLLLNNRHCLKRAHEELDHVVGKERWVQDSDIKHLVYLQAIVKETLRLYPPAPLAVTHEAMEDCNVCGYYVQKGTRLFVNVWKLHRDPTLWPDPEVFFPERFLTSQTGIDASGRHFEYLPFGSGRRACPGINLAFQVMHLTLARLLQGFELATPLNTAVDMSEGSSVTLPRTTPLEILLTPRLSHSLYQH